MPRLILLAVFHNTSVNGYHKPWVREFVNCREILWKTFLNYLLSGQFYQVRKKVGHLLMLVAGQATQKWVGYCWEKSINIPAFQRIATVTFILFLCCFSLFSILFPTNMGVDSFGTFCCVFSSGIKNETSRSHQQNLIQFFTKSSNLWTKLCENSSR